MFHELPAAAAADVIAEAHRVLRPGGVLTIMVER
jgi:predicted methyltransferase